jgi:hypothetical protein
MRDTIARIAAVAVLLACALPCAQAAEPLAPALGEHILVLRNGEIFEGKITRTADGYVVERPGIVVRVAAADAEMVCANLEEAYRRKRATIQVGNVHHHLELAQWCLRYKLYGQVAVELADATLANPKDPMIEALRHRLRLAIEPPRPVEPGRPPVGPSSEDLDRMVRGLPRGFVETFTQSVQPVLLNGCTGAGCHGPQSTTSLKLFRVPANRTASQRITQRNLYGVLQYVNTSNPSASELLRAASEPHGTARYAVFGDRQAPQYRRLADWTSQLAQPAAGMAEAPFDAPPVLLPRDTRRARPMTAADPRRGDHRVSYGASPLKVRPGDAAPASFNEPIDPWDPEALNRRRAVPTSDAPAAAPGTPAAAPAAPPATIPLPRTEKQEKGRP